MLPAARHLATLLTLMLGLCSCVPVLGQNPAALQNLLDRLGARIVAKRSPPWCSTVRRPCRAWRRSFAARAATRKSWAGAAAALTQIAARVGPKAKAALPALGSALRGDDAIVAAEAARALGYLGGDATPELIRRAAATERCRQPDAALLPPAPSFQIGTSGCPRRGRGAGRGLQEGEQAAASPCLHRRPRRPGAGQQVGRARPGEARADPAALAGDRPRRRRPGPHRARGQGGRASVDRGPHPGGGPHAARPRPAGAEPDRRRRRP